MNAETNKMRASLVEQLSSFENRLDNKIDDVRLLADIQEGIGQLLGAAGGKEAEIRRVLQERYDSGALRKETFQLVKSMLDRYVTENVATSGNVQNGPATKAARVAAEPVHEPTIAEAARNLDYGDDRMSQTVVIPTVAVTEPATADDRVQVGSVLRDRFMLQERMSGGSMGVVYKALDRRLAEAGAPQPYVAVKVLSPHLAENGQALRALQQEAAKGRCLAHPNIVRFIDLDRDEDLYFIVMEWLEGRTLADILDAPETDKIDQSRAFEIVRQIAKALEYAHRCGIVHADVKPGNIMITPQGDAKLFDFGVARVRQKQIEDRQEFDPGVLGLLTPAYSSMQVLTGEDPVPSDDVFSLACLFYRLLAGYRVFGPRNAAEAAAEGMKPQCPQGLSEQRWRVLKKALSYSRVTRFETMQDFIDALDVGVNEPITITVPIRDELDVDEDAHGSGRWIAGFIVLVGLLGVAGYQFGVLDDLSARFLPAGSTVVDVPAPQESPIKAIASQLDPADDIVVETDDAAASSSDTDVVATDEMESGQQDAANLPGAELDDASSPEALPEALAEPLATESEAAPEPPPLVDFSTLPRADVELRINRLGTTVAATTITLREDRGPLVLDLVRSDVSIPLAVRVEEVGFSGNRSPWVAGQYTFGDQERVEFPPGQERARLTFAMTSDPIREADQQSTLRIREVDSATSELAIITVNLEDDDQRAFESFLPANTVAFAASQITVRERDPAVQIDILRFNPDETRMVVAYVLRDITATRGEDYFAPANNTIEFGPGQRSARLLIPLVQDTAFESNEAFSIELSTADSTAASDVYLRTAVIIRDDDS